METPARGGTEPAKLESGEDRLGFTTDHDDNAMSETRYHREIILADGKESEEPGEQSKVERLDSKPPDRVAAVVAVPWPADGRQL